MRNFLNVLADILILLAVAIAGVGHMFPWFTPNSSRYYMEHHKTEQERQQARKEEEEKRKQLRAELIPLQTEFAVKSGASLGVLALLTVFSLLIPWGAVGRRVLVVLMFAAAMTAIVFINMGFSPYASISEDLAGNYREEYGFFVALIPTCFAAGFCLIRMLWTMPPQRDKVRAVEAPPRRVDAPPFAQPVEQPYSKG